MSILDDSTEDHIASSGFIPGTQFTRTKTVSLLDQIKEREREEKLENLFESGALYSSSKKDEDDVDELLEIFGGEEDARFEDDDDDDVERKQEEEEDAREIFDADGKNSSGRLILKVDADSWTEDAKHKISKRASTDPSKWDQRRLEVPIRLAERLQEYQRDGVRFLHGLYARNLGGLLADDMGLGKTVQCVAFVFACLTAEKPRGGFAYGANGKEMVKKKSIWQDEENDEEDEEEENKEKDENDDTERDEVENIEVVVEEEMEETRYDMWGKRKLLTEEEAKRKGVNVNNRRPILIIVPTTLIGNWKNEFEKWSEAIGDDENWDVTVVVAHGNNREVVYDDIENHRGVDVVITTANIISRDVQANPDFNLWTNTGWDFCIIDEMHASMKNPKTQVFKAMCQLKCLKFGLSGTPYQNKPEELHTIFDLLNTNCLGSRGHFKSYYEVPMNKARSRTASKLEIGRGRQRAKQLQGLMNIYMLKRMKSEVLKAGTMKAKTEKVVFCDLAPAQRRAYERIRESTSVQLILNKETPCDCGSGEKRIKCCYPANIVDEDDGDEMWCAYGPHGRHKTCPMCVGFACVFACRNVSNHLELLKPLDLPPNPKEEDVLKQKRAQAVAKVALGDELDALGGLRPQQNFLAASNFDHCGKMKTLSILLERFHKSNDKVVLFSYSVRLLNVMNEFVKRMGYVHVRLDGGTAVKERQKIVDDFNTRGSCFLFLMSSEAGGVGLNIASANKVIIFDPAWNPAKDLQSQDRVYRLGNRRDVEVYRLISAGTLEELVYSRQIYKQQMGSIMTDGKMERRIFDGVQGDYKKKGELWGIVNLLRLNMSGKVEMREKVEAEKRKDIDADEEEDIIKEEGYQGEDGFNFRVAKGLDKHQVRDIGNALEEEREAAAKRGENIFEGLLDEEEDLHALHTMDHNKIFGVSEREKKRVEDAEMASKTEKLLKRLAKRKDVDARMEEDVPRESYKSKRKKNALDPHDHEVQDMALRAMAKYNNISELDFAKHFLSIKTEEEAQYALIRNVEGLKIEMEDNNVAAGRNY
tara:strand:- start:1005 stop:4130 length:3126 start_codon:yes stop_codon:yes gene_type:complete